MIQHTCLCRPGRTGEAEPAPLIHSRTPSSAQMSPDSGAIYNCRPSSPPSELPGFFFLPLCAGGTGGRLKGICDLIITPSPHLDDPPASISLSAPPLPMSLPFPRSFFTSLSPASIFHPISRLLGFSLCVCRTSCRCSVGCSSRPPYVGRRRNRWFSFIRRGGREGAG